MGFGTGTAWYKPDRFSEFNPAMVSMLKDAISAGYRHLDTAEGYGTEAELGQAVKESGVPRGDLFVTTKIAQTITEGPVENVALALENSLKRLQMDYVDLLVSLSLHWSHMEKLMLVSRYILHTPYLGPNQVYDEDKVAKAWKLIEGLQRSGKARAIGISNFRKHHVENLLKTAEIKPAVNQLQFHAYLQGAPEYAKWLQAQGIAVQSYMGLAPITHLKGLHLEGTLKEIAEKHNVSASSVLIRWQLDQGIIVLNTTKKTERMKEYFEALSLKLSNEEQDRITTVGQGTHVRVPIGPLFDGGETEPYQV